MGNDFSKLFLDLPSNQFNKVSVSDAKNVLEINILGLHKIESDSTSLTQYLHSHSFSELHFSLFGYATYEFSNGETLKIATGEWLLIPAEVPHKITEYSEEYIKYSCSFKLNERLSENEKLDMVYICFEELLRKKEYKTGIILNDVATCIEMIHSKFFDKNPFSASMLNCIANNIVISALSPLFKNVNIDSNSKEDTRLKIAVQFIKDNIFAPINLEDVARKVYLSPRQINRIFKIKLSMSVTEFIFVQKCELAKQLLISTDMSINQISEKLIFSDASYFSRFFKKRVGVSPQKFRKKNKTASKVDYPKRIHY